MSRAGLEVDGSLEERAGPDRIQGQTPSSGLGASPTTPSAAQLCVSFPAQPRFGCTAHPPEHC